MAQKVECNYVMMDTIGSKFRQQGDAIEETLGDLRRKVESLEGQWIGHGHDAFFQQMQTVVLPSMDRLVQALRAGANASKEITTLLSDEEDEAASAFRMTVS